MSVIERVVNKIIICIDRDRDKEREIEKRARMDKKLDHQLS